MSAAQRSGALIASAACSTSVHAEYPMSYLRTYGPAADAATRLNWGLIGISLGVVLIVGILVLWATLRRRPPLMSDADGRMPVGAARGGLRWIYVGVGVSTLVLLASTVWTVQTLSAIAAHSNVRR